MTLTFFHHDEISKTPRKAQNNIILQFYCIGSKRKKAAVSLALTTADRQPKTRRVSDYSI